MKNEYNRCKGFTFHRNFIIHPKKLIKAGVPVGCLRQDEGDLIILAAGTLHAGFNLCKKLFFDFLPKS